MRTSWITAGAVGVALVAAFACAKEGKAEAGPSTQSAEVVATTAAAAAAPKEDGKQIWRGPSGSPVPAVAVPQATSLAPLVKQLKPVVVNISTTTVVKSQTRGFRGPGMGGDENEMLERFFGPRQMPEQRGTGLGSGFIINEDGHVLTNNHVVKDATDIKVRLSDGREFEAKVVGRDAGTDVALIKLQKVVGKLPTAVLGDSDALEQGDFVVAVGSPLGFRESVTFGIISAKDRQLTGSPFDDFLQTDAAINQGNSGGPLFNTKGEVIGINTAIISPQIGSGIGFAVPINLAKQLIPQLLTGKVSRGYLGVTVSELTPDLAQGFGLKEGTKGALVEAVQPRAPAAKAGLQPGDVVVAVDGKSVESASQLTKSVSSIKPGGSATLTVLRGDERKQMRVTVAQRPSEEALARGQVDPDDGSEETPDREGKSGDEKLGIRVAPMTAQIANELGVTPGQGVFVAAVTPGGPAAEAGIRRTDVILEVNRQPVNKVEQLVSMVNKAKPGQTIVLRVQRGGVAKYFAVKLGGGKK